MVCSEQKGNTDYRRGQLATEGLIFIASGRMPERCQISKVARMERSVIRGESIRGTTVPDCASLHPGYALNFSYSIFRASSGSMIGMPSRIG